VDRTTKAPKVGLFVWLHPRRQNLVINKSRKNSLFRRDLVINKGRREIQFPAMVSAIKNVKRDLGGSGTKY
jgi:hypothetical protein